VLPFANVSADPAQEYFSDGLADEIISALAKIQGLKVIARTSAFAFKGQHTDIRKIADTLGVAKVLEGSVRRADNRIRVTVQLVAAADGSHRWSERYEACSRRVISTGRFVVNRWPVRPSSMNVPLRSIRSMRWRMPSMRTTFLDAQPSVCRRRARSRP
jgi:TolB-like protein